MGTIFLLFHSERNAPVRRVCLKIISNGIQTESPHIISMQIIMLSNSWTLLESRSRMNFPISSAESVTVDVIKDIIMQAFVCSIINMRKKRTIVKN